MAGIVRQLFIGCASLALLLLCPLVCSSQPAIDQKHCKCTSISLSVDSSELRGRCTCQEYGMMPDYILQKTVVLWLDYSQPVVLTIGNIQKFNRIRVLNISGMQFVEPGGFQGLETLERLVLYDNYMRVLENNMFAYLESLTRLIVEGTPENKIYALENGTFCNLTKLKRLNLRVNAITDLIKEHFRDLETLDIIDLSDNRLTQIKAHTFINATLLTEIYLSKNLITKIHHNAFVGLKRLVTLDLEGNRIKGMPQPVFSPGSLRGSDVQHKNIHLDNNLLRCDCHLNWISSWLDRGKICEGRCRTPSKLFNLTLEHVYKDGLPQCQPNNTIWHVDQGIQLKLTCPFAGASWVTPDGSHFQEHGDCEDPFCLTNSDSLVIWKTTPELSGNYTCFSSDGTKLAFVSQVDVKAFTVAMIAGLVAGGFLLMVIIIVAGCKLRKHDSIRLNSTPGNPPRGNPPQGNPSAEHDTCVDGDDRNRLLQEDMDRVSSAKLARAVKYESIIFQKDSLSDIKNINIFNSKST